MATQTVSPETPSFRPEFKDRPENIIVQFGDGTTRKFTSRAELIRAMRDENDQQDRWN
jgi:hypothetical protein